MYLNYRKLMQMRSLETILLSLLFSQMILAACPEGQFPALSPPVTGKGECVLCMPQCKTCANLNVCLTYIDQIKGYTSTMEATCGTQFVDFSYQSAYNKNLDACTPCDEGCQYCLVDSDYCLSCTSGYDWDSSKFKCAKVTLSLAATILALSIVSLIIGVVSCILACRK